MVAEVGVRAGGAKKRLRSGPAAWTAMILALYVCTSSTYYVKPVGRGALANATGADTSHAWTLAHACSTAVAGDVVYLSAGSYYTESRKNCDDGSTENATLWPLNGGTGAGADSSIRFIGITTYPSNVAVYGGIFEQPYLSVSGVRFVHNFSVTQRRGDAPTSTCYYDGRSAYRDSISRCMFSSSLSIDGATECVFYGDSSVVDTCTGQGCCVSFDAGSGTGFAYGGRPSVGNTYRAGVITISKLDGDSRGIYYGSRASFNRMDSTKVTASFKRTNSANGARTGLLWSKTSHDNAFSDNRWTVSSVGAAGSGNEAIYLRDSTYNWSFVRDTFALGGADSAGVSTTMLLAASGSMADGAVGSVYSGNKKNVHFDFCHFKSGGNIWTQDGAWDYSWHGCTFFMAAGAEFQVGTGKAYGWNVDHCSFYGQGHQPVTFYGNPSGVMPSVVRQNVFMRNTTSGHRDSAVVKWAPAASPANLVMDQNLFFSGTDSSAHAWGWGSASWGCVNGCGVAPCRLEACWTLFSGGRDASSFWGNPRFTTVARDSFYGQVLCNTLATVPAADSAVGARQPNRFRRPAAVGDLAQNGAATTGQIPLTWTSPGDDSLKDVALAYEVRYSTQAITTEDQWAAGTYVTNTMPAPAAAGTARTVTVTGLSADTQYFFSVRTYNTCLNLGGLSNSLCAWTKASSGIQHTCDE